MKILIAEDELALRRNLQRMLELEGYEVTAAADGQEAFEHACRERPDLVISDVMMPELDGYGLIKALRERPTTATVPIILLSAKADTTDVRVGMNMGADDYLSKPYRRADLLETMRTRLARQAKLAELTQLLAAETQGPSELDALTGLPGLARFEEQLQATLASDPAQPSHIAVLYLGLDGLSKINHSLGRAVGDQVLRLAAERLSAHRPNRAISEQVAAMAARAGGDVFAVCLTGRLDAHSLADEAASLLRVLAQPYAIGDHTLFLSASAGASLGQCHTSTAHAALMSAEAALYQAKLGDAGSYFLANSEASLQVARTLQIHNDLHQALDKGELQIFYQPQIRIQTGELVGFEALLRWPHPTLGWLSPTEFIAVAEESELIVRIGEWVMRTAARQAAEWAALGHTHFCMAVNLSARQFASPQLLPLVKQILAETGLPPPMLELEITESMALQGASATLASLNACKALGVKLAMDDFGTGYSSLSYLKRYPLDSLKIDQSFVRNITEDAGDAAITRAIVALAHSFGMTVIAEGVEKAEQLAYLRTLGCDYFQGYLMSRPVAADEAVKCFAGFRA